MKIYASMMCFSPDYEHIVLLLKTHGPAFLVGKLNFPGGHQEPGETPVEAAIREFFEETGVQLTAEQVTPQFKAEEPGNYALTVCYGVSERYDQVVTTTDEEVMVMRVASLFDLAAKNPDVVAPDVVGLVKRVLALQLECAE